MAKIELSDLKHQATDMFKKVLTASVGTFFLTEEALKNLFSELKLPKEMLLGLVESAQKTKNDLIQKVSSEVTQKIGEKLDPKEMVNEILKNFDLEVTAKISFKPRKKED